MKPVRIQHQFFKPHKYKAKPTEVDGIRFDSSKEARFFSTLKLLKRSGGVLFFLRQVPIHLPGKTKLVIDFVVFYETGDVEFIDVKGFETEVFKLKKRQVEELYPFKLVIE
jgi:hypothetical protein